MRAEMMIALALLVSGCAAPHQVRDRSDFLAEGTRTYQGESTERVIDAAQAVLRQSDPNDFEFRNSLNGFTGLRRYVIYAVIAAAAGREKWEFTAEMLPSKTVRASVAISEAGTASGGYSSQPYENAMQSVPLYRLFWSRVDYVLGRRPDWITCDAAGAELESSNTNVTAALGGLCGPTSDGRNSPAPSVLSPLPRVAEQVRRPGAEQKAR